MELWKKLSISFKILAFKRTIASVNFFRVNFFRFENVTILYFYVRLFNLLMDRMHVCLLAAVCCFPDPASYVLTSLSMQKIAILRAETFL